MTQRWKLTIEYDGSDFVGWQVQKDGISVQSCIEQAIFKFSGEKVLTHVAGRTDAGVHATGQVAHFDLERVSSIATVRDAINAHLRPRPISVIKAEPVAPTFHARFDALHRVYCYKILTGRWSVSPLELSRVWQFGVDLNIDAMNEGAQFLIGKYDFSSFRSAACQAKSPMRSIERLEVIEVPNSLIYGRHIEIWVGARSFLHHQIRNIVGALKQVGDGKLAPHDIKTILEAKNRTIAPAMAPAAGLYFTQVYYP